MRKSVPYQGRAMTLEQISKEMGISYERVRQIERAALNKVKAKLDSLGISAELILPTTFDETRQ